MIVLLGEGGGVGDEDGAGGGDQPTAARSAKEPGPGHGESGADDVHRGGSVIFARLPVAFPALSLCPDNFSSQALNASGVTSSPALSGTTGPPEWSSARRAIAPAYGLD